MNYFLLNVFIVKFLAEMKLTTQMEQKKTCIFLAIAQKG